MVMNIFDNKKLASVLVKSTSDMSHGEPEEEESNEDAHNLELVKSFFKAGQEGKFEKALIHLEMLVENIWKDCEDEAEEYDGMKSVNAETY